MHRFFPVLLPIGLTVACSDVKEDAHAHDHSHGLTTALVLHFTDADGAVDSFWWEDPEADGVAVQIDEIVLTAGIDYGLELEVLNQLAEPVDDVTVEIAEAGTEHQFFFTGDAVRGPASDSESAFLQHTYADTDATGLPLGIQNQLTTLGSGTGALTVTLRHLPNEGSPIKVDGLAETVAAEGFGSIGGETDIQVTFPVVSE